MVAGSKKVADTVRVTMGPHGRLVAIDPFEVANFNELSVKPEPKITKDGVTVTKAINYISDAKNVEKGRLQNIGAKLLIDAASRTEQESGDGTTACTVIADSIIQTAY